MNRVLIVKPARPGIILCLSLCAGGGDLATGLLLVFAPLTALALMHVPAVNELVFLRFVGCFVATVGLSYLIGLICWIWDGAARLRTVWELTIAFRLTAAIFVASQVAFRSLPWPWLSVPVVDLFWCFVQAGLLRHGVFGKPHDESVHP